MFFLSTRFHAILDYCFSLFLMLAPTIFGFGTADSETIVPIFAGVMISFYSFFSKYEGGLYPVFSMKVHNLLDLMVSLFVATSPWVFGFQEIVYKPHLLIGFAFFLVSLFHVWPMIKFHKSIMDNRYEMLRKSPFGPDAG